MFIEIVQVIRYIFEIGESLRNKVYDNENENNAFLIKIFIIFVTVVNYGLSLFCVYRIYLNESSFLFAS